MQKIYIKDEVIPQLPEVEGLTIGWKEEYEGQQYGDFMYIPKELLPFLKEELCKK